MHFQIHYQHNFLIGIIFLILVSCKSQEATFTKIYEKELPETPSRAASMSPDGSYIFGLEAVSKTGLGTPSAFVVDESGEIIWTDKAKDLGSIERNPDNVMWIWDKNVALFFSRDLNFQLSCIDLTSGKEVWSVQDKNNGYSTEGFYVPSVDGIMLQTPQGLSTYNLEDGSRKWKREDIKIENDISDFVFGSPEGLDWIYLKEQNRLLVSSGGKLDLINPVTGESEWTITRQIGSLANADLYPDKKFAIFYGKTDESLGKALAQSTALGNMAMRAAESGLMREDMIVVDLESGEVKWESEFMTNGNHQPILKDDKLIMAGIVLNVYNKESGEILWRNIDEDRFSSDQLAKALGFLTGIDLTVGEQSKLEDLIYDHAIYAFYPEVLDKATSEKISLRKYDLDTGEELWKTQTENVSVDSYFGADGVLFLAGTARGFIPKPVLIAYDAATGKKLYEKQLKSTRFNDAIVENGTLYMLLFPWELRAFDVRSGEEIALEKPGRAAHDIRRLQEGIFVAYQEPGLVALHNKKDFSVTNQVKIPNHFDNYDYRGDTFFMLDLNGDPARGIVAIDIEQFELKGYLLNSQQGYLQNKQGDNLVYKDYHLFLTEDGNYVYELNKNVLSKYAVDGSK